MADTPTYYIRVKNPQSDVTKKINGTITFDIQGLYYIPRGTMTGLPDGNIITFTGSKLTKDQENIMVTNMISNLLSQIMYKYDLLIELEIYNKTSPKVEPVVQPEEPPITQPENVPNYEYVFEQSGSVEGGTYMIFMTVYLDGNEIYNSGNDGQIDGSEDGTAMPNDLKNDAIKILEKNGGYPLIKYMKEVDKPTPASTFTPEDVKKLSPPPPSPQVMSTTKGVNIENASIISQDCKNKIQKEQKKDKDELIKAIPDTTISEELAKSKLNELDIPKSLVSPEMDLSDTSIKDIIDTRKIDLTTYDLSKIKTTDLNLNYLIALGFSMYAIIGIVKLIKNKIKKINTEHKEKIKQKNKKSNNIVNVAKDNSRTNIDTTNTRNTTNTTNTSIDTTNVAVSTISDEYTKPINSNKRRTNNSNFSIDKRNRTDILNSSKAVSTYKNKLNYKNNPNFGKYFK